MGWGRKVPRSHGFISWLAKKSRWMTNLNDQVLARDPTILSPEVSATVQHIILMIVSFPFTFTFSVPGLPIPFSKIFSHNILSKGYSRTWPSLDTQNGKASGNRPALSLPASSSPPRQKNLKRGWEPELVESIGSQSSTTLVSTSGYHGPPSKGMHGQGACAVFRLLNYGLDASLRPLPRAPGRARALHARHTCSVQSPLLLTSQSL